MAQRGGHLNRILEDVCGMANTNGGTIYVGLPPDASEKIVGVREPRKAIEQLDGAVARRLSPDPEVNIDVLSSQGQPVVRITVPPGRDVPYAIDDNRFYVRDEAETTPAVRDEIVRLVERRILGLASDRMVTSEFDQPEKETPVTAPEPQTAPSPKGKRETTPRTGVEIVSSEERDGTIYHTVRDLRNGNLIKNVTRSSARKLWHYAITKTEDGIPSSAEINWDKNRAFLDLRRRDNHVWYDLAMRDQDGVHVYYGVTDSGLNEEWMGLVEQHADR
jgi:hypothetical protein